MAIDAGTGSAPWAFALAIYRQPTVADACLDAQDRTGADVVLLLFQLWAGFSAGHRLTPAQRTALAAVAAGWQSEVVAPLRQVRRRLKRDVALSLGPAQEELRRQVAGAEREAERLEMMALFQVLPLADGAARDAGAAFANLAGLCAAETREVLVRGAAALAAP